MLKYNYLFNYDELNFQLYCIKMKHREYENGHFHDQISVKE
jgi:hypothetical protein